MKKIKLLSVMLVFMLLLLACSKEPKSEGAKDASSPNNSITKGGEDKETNEGEKETNQDVSPKETVNEKVTMTLTEFDTLLGQQPVAVTSTKYIVQDENYKALYPDMLQAILTNNTSEDIKDAVIAFVAWDSNNLPVKIKGSIDFSEGTYIKEVNYTDINLIGGKSFGGKSGFSLEEDNKVSTFKAVPVSFVTFDGDIWENPYYDEWCTLYEGVKYKDELSVDVVVEDSSFEVTKKDSSSTGTSSDVSGDELEKLINNQDVTITSTKYVVQDENYKSLYPDMLQAVISNKTKEDIRDAMVAFVAWDANGLPVKIKGSIDFSEGAYIREVNYSDINLVPNSSFGDNSGFSIDENCSIDEFKAIVVSYTTFDDETWENPHYEDWCKQFEGKKLPQ